MERKNFAVLCAAVLCFWLFALALGTAEGVGLRAVMHPEERTVSADVEEAAEEHLLPTAVYRHPTSYKNRYIYTDTSASQI